MILKKFLLKELLLLNDHKFDSFRSNISSRLCIKNKCGNSIPGSVVPPHWHVLKYVAAVMENVLS